MSEEVKKKQTVEEMELEIKQLELKAKQLEVQEREANLQDMKERLDEREMKREQRFQRSKTNGDTLRQIEADTAKAQKRCNHKKGGTGQDGVVAGQGDSPQHSVIKHTFLNGDVWVRCLRCGKTWKPPIEENFYFDEKGAQVLPEWGQHGELYPPKRGKLNQEKYVAALMEYQAAVQFQTLNKPSSSYVFQYSDGGKFYRQITNNATLR